MDQNSANGVVTPPTPTQANTTTDQISKLTQQVEQSTAPSDLKEMLTERISRLTMLRSSSGYLNSSYIVEYENTATYIRWATSLPWDKRSQDLLDLTQAKQIFDKNHYGLDGIKNKLIEYLASIVLNLKTNGADHALRAPILCLVGLAGTGKTTLAASIAEALGRRFERIPFGGMGDARVLRGQSRAFPDAEPGVVIKKLVKTQTKNCVILLDELDRVSESARTDIMGVLVELLDPEQNKAFTDHYIDYPFDLSEVLFVATSNNTTNISTAVLDRLEVVQMPSYTDTEKMNIAKTYLFPKIEKQSGLTPAQLTIADDVWPLVIRPLGFDSGIRSLERTLQGMCRKVARVIVEGRAQSVTINAANIKEYLTTW